MTTYKADYKDGNIVLQNGNNIQKINITTLLLNNGKNTKNGNDFDFDFEQNQQELNYLDSIKDGTNASKLQQLETFPNSGNPPFRKLEEIKDKIKETKKNFLNYNSWLKVSKDSVLNPGKNYQNIFYEAGLKHYAYINNPNEVNTINTFGSYIDPLDKGTAKTVWPASNNSIKLTEGFMNLFGYGTSSIEATTINQKKFDYEMKINCGMNCQSNDPPNNQCILKYEKNKQIGGIKDEKTKNTMPNEFFFSGNNEKSKFLTEKGNSLGKNVFVVMKGWGDKVQVLIFFMYYHFINKSSVITSNDLVVFTLCMILSVPCIYVGDHVPPNIPKDDKSKYRSIIEYKPSDNPYDDTYAYATNELENIYKENQKFIGTIQYLINNPGIKIGDYVFKQTFYKAILIDITKIQTEFVGEKKKFIKKFITNFITNFNPVKSKKRKIDNNIDKINDLQKKFKEIKQKYLLVPFIKIKKGTSNKLVILMTKSYTAQKPCDNTKPSIQTDLRVDSRSVELSSLSFLEIGLKYFRDNLTVGGTPEDIPVDFSNFHKDEIDYKIDTENNKIDNTENNEVDYTNSQVEYKNFSMKYDEYYNMIYDESDEHDKYNEYNQDNDILINENIEYKTSKINLLKKLTESFETTMYIYQTKYKINGNIFYYFSDTIYTLYVYESYLNGYCSIDFNETILKNILKEYKLLITIRHTRRLFNFWSTNKTRKIRSNQPYQIGFSKTPSKRNINFKNVPIDISPTVDKIIHLNKIITEIK